MQLDITVDVDQIVAEMIEQVCKDNDAKTIRVSDLERMLKGANTRETAALAQADKNLMRALRVETDYDRLHVSFVELRDTNGELVAQRDQLQKRIDEAKRVANEVIQERNRLANAVVAMTTDNEMLTRLNITLIDECTRQSIDECFKSLSYDHPTSR